MVIWKYFAIGLGLLAVAILFTILGQKKGKKKLAENPEAKTKGQKFIILLTQGAVEMWIFALLALFLSTLFIGGAFRWW